MSYATQTDFTNRMGSKFLERIADRDGDGSVDTTAVTLALADAASEIDSVLGKGYDVPLPTPYPGWLVRCNVEIAAYLLGAESRGSNTKTLTARYHYWLGDGHKQPGQLAMIVKGKRSLGYDDEPDTNFEPFVDHEAPQLRPSDLLGVV